MGDIRELERQTQEALAKKMGSANNSSGSTGNEPDNESSAATTPPPPPSLPSNPDQLDKGQQQQQQQQLSADLSSSSGGGGGYCRTPVSLVSPVGPLSWTMSCISKSSTSDDDDDDWRSGAGGGSGGGAISPAMVRWSSMELILQGEEPDEIDPPSGDNKTQEDRLEVEKNQNQIIQIQFF